MRVGVVQTSPGSRLKLIETGNRLNRPDNHRMDERGRIASQERETKKKGKGINGMKFRFCSQLKRVHNSRGNNKGHLER